jgi:hypothetical protein
MTRIDSQVQSEIVSSGFNGHDNLFETAVTGALSKAVDRALDLTGTAYFDPGKGVRYGHAQIIMTMY